MLGHQPLTPLCPHYPTMFTCHETVIAQITTWYMHTNAMTQVTVCDLVLKFSDQTIAVTWTSFVPGNVI